MIIDELQFGVSRVSVDQIGGIGVLIKLFIDGLLAVFGVNTVISFFLKFEPFSMILVFSFSEYSSNFSA